MQLISPLAAGIRGAEGGSVNLVLRGTTTAATYYADFEATQQFSGTAVPLDADGRLIAYVSALVYVTVHDSLGNDVCAFVAGSEDAAVEVISPAFTGTDYTTGQRGVQKPTNLENVLDSWIASAGAPDWKVLVNGSAATLQSIVGVFFNVKSYGAVGNGTADDGSAITAANAAATAAGGGIVYFPPGTYRITASQPLPANVTWLGNGGASSKLAIDSGVGAGVCTLPANSAGSIATVSGMWLGAINGASPGVLITGSGVSAGEFHFTDCVLGNDALCNSNIYQNNASVAGFKIIFTRCYAKISAGAVPVLQHFGSGQMVVRDCSIISSQATPGEVVVCEDGGTFEGNRFDASAGTLGTVVYIRAAPLTTGTAAGGVVVIGNKFAANATLGAANCIALKNTNATPFNDILESCNIFGDPNAGAGGITPYAYVTDGYVSFANTFNQVAHHTRIGRTEVYPAVGATVTADPKSFGTTVIQRLAGAALTVNVNKGSQGDHWTLHVLNATAGALTVTPGTNIAFFDPAIAGGTLVLAAGAVADCIMQWLPTTAAAGRWHLIAKSVTN